MGEDDASQALPRMTIGDTATFTIAVRDIFSTPVDAIVNPANGGLSHGGGLAARISMMAGEELDRACDEIIERDGMLETGDAVITTAGQLDFKAVVHAVGPRMGTGDELVKLELAIANSLRVASHAADYGLPTITSLAFPMISAGIYGVPKSIVAQAFANVMKPYIANEGSEPGGISDVWLCVESDDFALFTSHYDSGLSRQQAAANPEDDVAEFSIDETSLATDGKAEEDDWFN